MDEVLMALWVGFLMALYYLVVFFTVGLGLWIILKIIDMLAKTDYASKWAGFIVKCAPGKKDKEEVKDVSPWGKTKEEAEAQA